MAAVPSAARLTRPHTREDWAVVYLALVWGFAYGFGARQAEAMAMRSLGLTVGSITLLNAALIGAGVLGARTWGRFGDRFGGKGLMVLAMTAFALDPVWSLLAMYVHPAAFLPQYIIWGVFMTAWNIAQSLALVRQTGHPADRIRLITMYNVAYGVAAGVAPLLGGALLTWTDARFSSRAAFATLFAVTIALRLAALPVLLRLPANSAGARHISTVYMRLVRMQTSRGTRVVGSALRAPLRLLPTRH
jgi:MFS family permease